MMLAVAARRIASRTAVVLPSILRAAPSSALQLFSTEAKIPKEPQWGIGKLKTSTGLTGLDVEPDWYNVMNDRFQALLDKMEASDMPETAQFRIDVTKWCNFVLNEVEKAGPDDPEAVEEAVNLGQVEELIEMAEDEMIALDCYLETRMWELVEKHNPVIDFEPDPIADPMAPGQDLFMQTEFREGIEAILAQDTTNEFMYGQDMWQGKSA